ncbi:MAG: 50S ribosomal protein L21 [Candidatus Shapirobacteria bacterium]
MKQAVIDFLGHQYLVKETQTIEVDKYSGKKGDKIEIEKVLLIFDNQDKKKVVLGAPLLKSAKVEAEIIDQVKGEKIYVRRYRAKSRYRKLKGFRPSLTKLKITKISYGKI